MQCEKWNPFATLPLACNIRGTVSPRQRVLSDGDVVIVASTTDERELNVRTKELYQLLKNVTDIITRNDGR